MFVVAGLRSYPQLADNAGQWSYPQLADNAGPWSYPHLVDNAGPWSYLQLVASGLGIQKEAEGFPSWQTSEPQAVTICTLFPTSTHTRARTRMHRCTQ